MILHTYEKIFREMFNEIHIEMCQKGLPLEVDFNKYAQDRRLEKPKAIFEFTEEGLKEFENEQEHESWKKEQEQLAKNKVIE